MAVYLVISLPKIPYTYTVYIGFWPALQITQATTATCQKSALNWRLTLVHTHLHLHLRLRLRLRTHIYIHIYTYTSTPTHLHLHIYTYTYAHTYTYATCAPTLQARTSVHLHALHAHKICIPPSLALARGLWVPL